MADSPNPELVALKVHQAAYEKSISDRRTHKDAALFAATIATEEESLRQVNKRIAEIEATAP